jgi:hypothetical protein
VAKVVGQLSLDRLSSIYVGEEKTTGIYINVAKPENLPTEVVGGFLDLVMH